MQKCEKKSDAEAWNKVFYESNINTLASSKLKRYLLHCLNSPDECLLSKSFTITIHILISRLLNFESQNLKLSFQIFLCALRHTARLSHRTACSFVLKCYNFVHFRLIFCNSFKIFWHFL